jgi:hypothetical protein
MAKEFCHACGGEHEPDPPDSWVDFRGYRFKPPFLCMCCGKVICGRQFAFGRCCGPCDMGACQMVNTAYQGLAAHPTPPWGQHNGEVDFRKFVEYVEAIPSPQRGEK